MNARPVFFLVLMFTIIPMVSSAMVISVQVEDVLNGRSSYLNINKTSFVAISLDWENTGSLDCNARLEAEITDPEGKVHKAWSPNVALAPGDSTILKIYYLPLETGNYKTNLLLHYCERIATVKSFNFDFEKTNLPQLDASFTAKSTENKITFTLKPTDNLGYVEIIPLDVPKTWIFNPAEANNLAAGKKSEVVMNYEPVVWVPRNVTFAVVSDKGYREVNVELTREDTTPWALIIVASLLVISALLNLLSYTRTRRIWNNRSSDGEERTVKHKSKD